MRAFRYGAVLALGAALCGYPPLWGGAGLSAAQLAAFRCRCCGRGRPDARFERLLAALQARRGERLRFTSGFRCAAHNARVGGAANSRHLRGQAADIAVPAKSQAAFCRDARACGMRRVLPCPSRGYVHLSM